jgi:lycopene cyclase domain-containing protein
VQSAMTYGQFHWIINAPFLLLCFVLAGGAFWSPQILGPAAVILLVVVVFTSPWDNFAVAKGIWGFPRNRYRFSVGYLPIEEYLFFIWESLQAMALTVFFLNVLGPFSSIDTDWSLTSLPFFICLGVTFGLWAVLGLTWGRGKGRSKAHYAWHLIYWFAPIFALHWLVGWNILLPRWPVVVLVTLVVGTVLSVADFWAVRKGIWFFDEKQITGHKIRGLLPWEEVAFFYLTALIVSQSLIIVLPEAVR